MAEGVRLGTTGVRSIMVTMTTNDAPMATHRVIQADADGDDGGPLVTGTASGGSTRMPRRLPPSRGKTPAGDSLLTTRTKGSGGSSGPRLWGTLTRAISGIDDGGHKRRARRGHSDSGPHRRDVGSRNPAGQGASAAARRLGLVTHRDPVKSIDHSSKEAKRSSLSLAIIRSMTWARASGTSGRSSPRPHPRLGMPCQLVGNVCRDRAECQ